MTLLVLSLGSNLEPKVNIPLAVESLRRKFGKLSLSKVYESEALGFRGDNFLNLVASVECKVSLESVQNYLKLLEDRMGRDRNMPRFSDRTIDIDILLYGDSAGEECGLSLPRPEILSSAFVLCPLAELHPRLKYFPTNISFEELWGNFDKTEQKLWAIDLCFESFS